MVKGQNSTKKVFDFSTMAKGEGLMPQFDWVSSEDIKCIQIDKSELNTILRKLVKCRYCGNPVGNTFAFISYGGEIFEVSCKDCVKDRLVDIFGEQLLGGELDALFDTDESINAINF